jgi:hypothetical protein
MTELLRSLDQPRGWSVAVRFAFCCGAALLTALDFGLQGNGNLVWSGIFLGFILGLAWSSFFLFGVASLARGFRPPVRVALWAVSLFAVVAISAVVCFQIWR